MILSIIAIVLVIATLIFVVLWTRAAQRNMREVREGARLIKGFNGRLTRLQNTTNNKIIGQDQKIRGITKRLDKIIEYPNVDKTVD